MILPQTARTQTQPHQGGKVFISRDACSALTVHVPSPDVAYQPGVTVDGRKVAPADLDGGPQLEMGYGGSLGVDVTTTVGQLLPDAAGILSKNSLAKGEIWIGRADIVNGHVYWNGKPIGGQGDAAIATACGEGQVVPGQ